MRHKVYVVKCPGYDQAEEKLSELMALMGGMSAYVGEGEEILLKVNLLQAADPDRAVSTHPAVAAAAARQVRGAGARAVICDSPGGYRSTEAMLRRVYDTCGMTRAAEASGAELSFDLAAEEVPFPQGGLVKHFKVLRPIRQADGVLNLCKLKTHVFMSMTGAVKNSFGAIPGLGKVGCHTRFQKKEQFADMLLDLSGLVAPRLSIMDAVVGMEGEGPGASGTPRAMGLLLACESPLALDLVAAEIIGLPRAHNPVLLAAERRGLTPVRIEDVEVVGARLDELRLKDFRLPAGVREDMTGMPRLLRPLAGAARRLFGRAPRVDPEKCVGCGVCRDACPVKAISLTDKKAGIDGKRCIRCYCCHELCPASAVAISAQR